MLKIKIKKFVNKITCLVAIGATRLLFCLVGKDLLRR